MNLPRTAAEALTDHVIFEIEGIDRMYLNVFVPRLQRAPDVAVGYLMRHRGFPIASTALVAEMSRTFISGLLGYARAHQVPVPHHHQPAMRRRLLHVAERLIQPLRVHSGHLPDLRRILQRAPSALCIVLWIVNLCRHQSQPQHRAKHPPIVQAQAGVRLVALAQLQRAAVGQLQVQRAVLQALQQAQAVARRGRQAG